MYNELISNITDTINLYKEKELGSKTNLLISIENNNPDKRMVSVNYGDNYFNKMDFSTEDSANFDSLTIFTIINNFKKDETFQDDSIVLIGEDKCNYQCTFTSGRKIILDNLNFNLANAVKTLLSGQPYQINNLQSNIPSTNTTNGGFSSSLLLIVAMLLILDVIFVTVLWIKNMS